MPVAEIFAESVVHRSAPFHARLRGLSSHVVLGRRLRPFCYWHAAALDWIRSPWIGHRGIFDLAALQVAAHVCSSVYPRINVPPRGMWRACFLQYRYGRFLARELNAFSSYLADYNSIPIFGETTADGETTAGKVPGYLLAVVQLMRAGLSKTEAWMMPIGEGGWLVTADAAAQGADLRALLDDEDLEAFAELGVEVR